MLMIFSVITSDSIRDFFDSDVTEPAQASEMPADEI